MPSSEPTGHTPEQAKPLGDVVRLTKGWIERLGEIWISAEVTELRRRKAQYQFLTFKDKFDGTSCSVTMLKHVLDNAGPLTEGTEVIARVKPRLYERTGSFSFYCTELRIAGVGRLLARVEELRRKLQAEGLFDPARKKLLPRLPKLIGLVTSQGSDAERDVLTNARNRWPGVKFKPSYALMQGTKAAADVIRALTELDEDPDVDLIVITRGGGSLEDLLPFSDEGLVRAVADCHTPVVSAIGHEADSPILDNVADLRASTPTDAGKRIVPDVEQELREISFQVAAIRRIISGQIEQQRAWLTDLRSRRVLKDPTAAFEAHYDQLALARHRLRSAIRTQLDAEHGLCRNLLTSVRALSPKATLERGYSVLSVDGRSLTSIKQVKPRERISATLSDGELALSVEKIIDRSSDD